MLLSSTSVLRRALPPSRDDNPFATCWTRPGALPYDAVDAPSPERVLAAWRRGGECGQLVGRHGAGKTTLLVALGDLLESTGREVRRVTFRPGEPSRLPRESPAGGVLLVDGLEQLSPWKRRRLIGQCRSRGAGLIATTHDAANLPVLAELAPATPAVLRLFRALTRRRPSPLTEGDVAAEFARCGGDVRELWFRLYDAHEALSRAW